MVQVSDIILVGLYFLALLSWLYFWGWQKNDETKKISDAAGSLQISEYQLFLLAAQISSPLNENAVKSDFIFYLKYDTVPFYVRWFLINSLKKQMADCPEVSSTWKRCLSRRFKIIWGRTRDAINSDTISAFWKRPFHCFRGAFFYGFML